MNETMRILIVDDEKIALKNLEHLMRKEGYDVVGTQSGQNALKLLAEQEFDIVLTDLRMEKVDGMHVLKRCRDLHPQTAVILITGYATLESAVQAMKQGAFNYVAKPFKIDEVRSVVKEAVAMVTLRRETTDLIGKVDAQVELETGRVRIMTQDARMREIVDIARRCAVTDCHVLIEGAVGTGKELLARFIHTHSNRSTGPFVKVNCSVMEEEDLGREIFGLPGNLAAESVEKGAISQAESGTLYLDEIDRMSPTLQLRLLNAIQTINAGGIAPSVRFIAACEGGFNEAIRSERLRSDLFYLLNVVLLGLPSLCHRRDDISLLAYFFLRKHSALMRKDVREIAPEALSVFMNYDFPGNIRELESMIERGVVICNGPIIQLQDLPEGVRDFQATLPGRRANGRIPTLEEQEMAYIQWVLRETEGNRSAAAQILGIDRVSLWRKLKKLGLDEA